MPNIYGNTDIIGDLLVTGSFSVLGTASVINTENLLVSDPIIALGVTQTGLPILDEGIMFVRGTGLTQALIWDESEGVFAFIGTNDQSTVIGDVNINNYSGLRVGNFQTETIRITQDAQAGYFLVSDALGNGSWTASSGGGTAGTSGSSGSSGTSGVSGSSGTSGVSGSSGTSGISFNWLGTWSILSTYNINDVVEYNGSSFISILGSNFGNAPTNPMAWNLMAQIGASGTSGVSGSSGTSGISGSSGTSGLLSLTGTTNNGLITLNTTAPNATVESNLTFDGGLLSVYGDLVVTGSFTVSGTSSVINTTNLLVQDPIILLAATQSGVPTLDSGVFINRGIGATQALIWDESDDTFALISTDDSNSVIGNVSIGTYSSLRVGGLTTSSFKLTTGPSNGYILTSDSFGNGSWQPSGTTPSLSEVLSVGNSTGGNIIIVPSPSYIGFTSSLYTMRIFPTTLTANWSIIMPDKGGTMALISDLQTGLTGGGTLNYLSKWSATKGLTDSIIYDDGSRIAIGTTSTNSDAIFQINNTLRGKRNLFINDTANNVSSTSSNSFGVYTQMTNTGTSSTGYQSIITGAAINNYGLSNTISNATFSYGVYNSISSSPNAYGVYNQLSSTGLNYGLYNSSSTAATNYGVYNLFLSNSGTKYGLYNFFNETGSPTYTTTVYGVYSHIFGGQNTYGQYILISPGLGNSNNRGSFTQISTTGSNWGSIIDISGSGNATGSNIRLSGTGSNNTGIYLDIGSASNNYGIIVNRGYSIFNESGEDNDFRIEGLTNSNLFFVDASNDNIGVGTSTPSPSSILHLSSTTQGFLPPVMTGAQAEAINNLTEGLLVYANNGNGVTITSTGWWGYNGSTWSKLN